MRGVGGVIKVLATAFLLANGLGLLPAATNTLSI
jgi:hypothetical protein